jgi:6-phosphofructokinase 2
MTRILTVTMNPALDVWADTSRIIATSKMRCEHVQRHPGGGGVNVARVLHRLGADCVALCALGGPTGQSLADLLQQEGVATSVLPIAGQTRESFTVAAIDSHQEYRFVLPGPQLQPDEWQACLQRVADWQPVPQYLVASGSLPPGVPEDFLARLGKIAGASGAKLVVDSSGPALAAALAQGVFMVKPSWRELRELTGLALATVAEVRQAALRWVHGRQAQIVVISMGDQGAFMATANGCYLAAPLAVEVVSAVGAGDSFVAGFTWALDQGMDAVAALRHGVACGSAALKRPGTALCDKADVQALVGQVQCQAQG